LSLISGVYFNLVIGTFSQNTESPTNPVRFSFLNHALTVFVYVDTEIFYKTITVKPCFDGVL
ncbi:hypothetical protein, partial [Acinetobacter baumannii]|uniref:hypothetical protein n=1 Tax=Acinetobacter baumannii TaxID=470 RepID=UPI001BC88BB4